MKRAHGRVLDVPGPEQRLEGLDQRFSCKEAATIGMLTRLDARALLGAGWREGVLEETGDTQYRGAYHPSRGGGRHKGVEVWHRAPVFERGLIASN